MKVSCSISVKTTATVLIAVCLTTAALTAPAEASNPIQKIRPGYYAIYMPSKANGKTWVKYVELPSGISWLKWKKGAYTGSLKTKSIEAKVAENWLGEFCVLQDKKLSAFAITKSTAKKVSFSFTCD